MAFWLTDGGGLRPLRAVDRHNPRPGLRRWIAPNTANESQNRFKGAWVTVHDDGSVTLAAVAGGHRGVNERNYEGFEILSDRIECAVADLMGLTRATAAATGNDEYDLRVGINWAGPQPLAVLSVDELGYVNSSVTVPLHRYTPVETTMNAVAPLDEFAALVHDFVMDCVNQGGVSTLRRIQPPQPPAT